MCRGYIPVPGLWASAKNPIYAGNSRLPRSFDAKTPSDRHESLSQNLRAYIQTCTFQLAEWSRSLNQVIRGSLGVATPWRELWQRRFHLRRGSLYRHQMRQLRSRGKGFDPSANVDADAEALLDSRCQSAQNCCAYVCGRVRVALKPICRLFSEHVVNPEIT